MTKRRTLVLFPGIAADGRQFQPQRSLPFDLITPDWSVPHEGETLPDYARRMAEAVAWPERFVLGGVSFGGMVAVELARRLNPEGLVLIATCQSARGLTSVLRFLSVLEKAIPDAALRTVSGSSRRFLNLVSNLSPEEQATLADMLHQTPLEMVRRASVMIRDWDGVPDVSCPRLWIHGGKDRVVPIKKVQPDVVIPGAGHQINWTHAGQVNALIRQFVDGLA